MLRRTFITRSVVFTEQSPVLSQISKSLDLKSNLWIESWIINGGTDNKMFNVSPKEGHCPTKCAIWKYIELYNRDQVTTISDVGTNTIADYPLTHHVSYSTKKPYGKTLSFDMEAIAQKHCYQSKLWIPLSKMANKPDAEFTPLSKEKPHKFFITSNVDLYPFDLLEGEVQELITTPISASTRRFHRKTHMSEQLKAFTINHMFTSALYFTKNQIETAKLSIKPDSVPCLISDDILKTGNNYNAYNIEQLENYDNILANLGRYGTPDEPIFLFSGIDVRVPSILAAQKRFTQKYWVSFRDIEENNWKMKEGEESKGISMSTFDKQIEYYNVFQLDNPEAGFSRAGLLEMQTKE